MLHPIVIAVICILLIVYRLYGTFMAVKVLKIKEDRETPAHKFADGKDYVPTNKWVSFGHHFAAIAAAGPLVGPVLAAQFGYLPGLLWLLIGCCHRRCRPRYGRLVRFDAPRWSVVIGSR